MLLLVTIVVASGSDSKQSSRKQTNINGSLASLPLKSRSESQDLPFTHDDRVPISSTTSRLNTPTNFRQRRLPSEDEENVEDEVNAYFTDLDINSLGEGFALGAAFVLLLIVLCLLCCCCSMCCGGGGGGGGCLTDILALFCCYELFCDDSPGCFVPMDGADMC